MEGRTILHMACHEGYKNLVSFLIDNGASIEDTDDEGDTPLHYAAFGSVNSALSPNTTNFPADNFENILATIYILCK